MDNVENFKKQLRNLVIDIECPFCNGAGRVHSSGRNGDPMDTGEDCPRCVAHDLNEDDDDAGFAVEDLSLKGLMKTRLARTPI
jgi:ssDNA-binding Zn-finger/Zn-ribbon topoisomerase 1